MRMLLLAVLVASVAAAEDKTSPAKDASWRASEGFQAARWGMTVAEVLKVDPKAIKDDDGDIVAVRPVAGFPGNILYVFGSGRLKRVAVAFMSGAGGKQRTDEDVFRELRGVLSKKYGQETDAEEIETTLYWRTTESVVAMVKKFNGAVVIAYESQDLSKLADPLPATASTEL